MSDQEEKSGADLGIKVPGGEVNIKNVKSLNTIATVTTMVMVGMLAVFLYYHEVNAQQDKAQVATTLQKSNTDIAGILKEANQAQREQNAALVKAINDSNERTVNAISKLTSKSSEIACLSDPAMRNRVDARDLCKRLSRDDR